MQMSDEKSLVLSKDNIAYFGKSYQTDEYHSFVSAICKLLKDVVREINRLLKNTDDFIVVALCTRSLIELYLITYHICMDKKAEAKWMGQIHKDFVDMMNGLITLRKRHDDNADVSDIKTVIERATQNLKESELKSVGPFNIKQLAQNQWGQTRLI